MGLMAKCKLKVHFIKECNRAYCGIIITPVLLGSDKLEDITCRVCSDKYLWDKGRLREWKIGGNYGSSGQLRTNGN